LLLTLRFQALCNCSNGRHLVDATLKIKRGLGINGKIISRALFFKS
jgi:hypothetical protein